jgi:hypothetical protein
LTKGVFSDLGKKWNFPHLFAIHALKEMGV